jgi:septum formation protein
VSQKVVLLLASASPRRRQLLALSGWNFRVEASNVDESRRADEAPQQYVVRLAEEKARAALTAVREEQIVIAADTAVVDGDAILGKPADAAEAQTMLKQLRGHTHQVYTGIAALRVSDAKLVTDLCVTNVPMRSYLDEEIEVYTGSGDPLDKAGAYAIQHPGFDPVESMAGCYASVMGLPLCHLVRTLQQFDLAPAVDVPMNCQTFLQYECPVSAAILSGEQVG